MLAKVAGATFRTERMLARAMRVRPLWLLVLLAGCGALPKDPDGALERIEATHVLRAGASENSPWVGTLAGEGPTGIEPDLVRAFAYVHGARVEWTVNGEAPLMEALGERRLDVVVAGGTAKSPWKKSVGVTRAYASDAEGKGRVLFTAAGENALLLALDRFVVAYRPQLQARVDRERRQ